MTMDPGHPPPVKYGPFSPSGLEVAPKDDLDDQARYLYPYVEEKQACNDQSSVPSVIQAENSIPPENTAQNPKYNRRFRIGLVGAVIAVVVLASVLGGVLGSRASRMSATSGETSLSSILPSPSSLAPTQSSAIPPSSTQSSASGKATSIATFTSIRTTSPLSVTSWRKSNGVEIYLYYQGPDNQLRSSLYDSGRGSTTVNNSFWEAPVLVNSDISAFSPLASSAIISGTMWEPQIETFYSNSNNVIIGVNLNEAKSPAVGKDSIATIPLSAQKSSCLASYWPYVVFQGTDGQLIEARNVFGQANPYAPSAQWTSRSLGIATLSGSSIALVPLSTNFTYIANHGGYGLVYQGVDGRLAVEIPDQDSSASTNQTQSWPTAAGAFPDITLPNNTAIAAFSTSRPSDKQNRVNTYILYQTAGGAIDMVWVDDGTGWKTSSPSALANADSGTSIACLTMPTSAFDSSGLQVVLEAASSETRCYFQNGGAVHEVVLSGTDWVELGTLPIP